MTNEGKIYMDRIHIIYMSILDTITIQMEVNVGKFRIYPE